MAKRTITLKESDEKGGHFKDQEYAKSNKLGIWKYEFKYPWEWRKNYKKYNKFTVGYNEK